MFEVTNLARWRRFLMFGYTNIKPVIPKYDYALFQIRVYRARAGNNKPSIIPEFMRVLITGGAGYIGSTMCWELADNGHTPVIYDNFCTGFRELASGFETIEGCLCDRDLLSSALAGCDAVIHFAAFSQVSESVSDPRKYLNNNVQGTLTLLDAVLASSVRSFVFSSTAAVYGECSSHLIAESAPKQPLNPYGSSKLFLEHALIAYRRSHGLRSVSLRYFNAAGAEFRLRVGEMHAPETHLIPLALMAAAGVGPPLTIFGDDFPTPDGTCIRDYIHVTDLCHGHLRALDYLHADGGLPAFNLGTGLGTSVWEIIKCIQHVTGKHVPYCLGKRRDGDAARLVADPGLAHTHLKWRAHFDIEQIIKSAWDWLLKRKEISRRASQDDKDLIHKSNL